MTDDIVRRPRERVYEHIVEKVRELIRTGQLAPGDRLLPERQLAETLGVSRTAVREALKVLVSQGFIAITPGGGAHVTHATVESLIEPLATVVLKERKSVHDLIEAREILEVGCARLAALRADDADLFEIEQAMSEMNHTMRAGEPSEEADYAFHLAIAKASHNQVLASIMTMVRGLMKEVYSPSRSKLLENRQQLEVYCVQNEAILRAIRDGDADAASRLMEQHLSLVETELKRVEEGAGHDTERTPQLRPQPASGP